VFLSGGQVSELTILIGQDGGIRMVADSDWPLDSLRAHYGVAMAYRVRQQDHCVRLEGRAGSRTCLFETEKPDGAARLLLAKRGDYELAPPRPCEQSHFTAQEYRAYQEP
jgi:hypothetical protein